MFALNVPKGAKNRFDTVQLFQMPCNQHLRLDWRVIAIVKSREIHNVGNNRNRQSHAMPNDLGEKARRGRNHVGHLEYRLHEPAAPFQELVRIAAPIVQNHSLPL